MTRIEESQLTTTTTGLAALNQESLKTLQGINPLNRGPATAPRDLVYAKSLVAIRISNSRVNIVVHQHPAQRVILVHALSTGSVNGAVTFEHRGAATTEAAHAVLVDEARLVACASAHLHLVLTARRWLGCVVAAALTLGEEEVVVARSVHDE